MTNVPLLPTGVKVSFPIALSLDANGSGVWISQRMPYMCILNVAAQILPQPGTTPMVPSSGTWRVYIQNSNVFPYQGFMGAGQGGVAQGGPWALDAGEMIIIHVQLGPANGTVQGTCSGIQNVPPTALPALANSGGFQVITVTGDISVSDGGLAGSIAQNMTQFLQLAPPTALPTATTTSIAVGAGTTNAYPDGCASWQVVVTGLQNTTGIGCRILWQKGDGLGNSLGYVQRDTSSAIKDRIICSGILDAPAMTFQITLPAGAPAGCMAYLYATALLIQDNFYDNGIYQANATGLGFYNCGMDGILTAVSNTIGGGQNQSYLLPTYRGPAQLGIQMSQAGHLALAERTYLSNQITSFTNIPVSSSGQQQQILPIFLAGMNNMIFTYNDNGTTNNTFFMEVRAFKDLLD